MTGRLADNVCSYESKRPVKGWRTSHAHVEASLPWLAVLDLANGAGGIRGEEATARLHSRSAAPDYRRLLGAGPQGPAQDPGSGGQAGQVP